MPRSTEDYLKLSIEQTIQELNSNGENGLSQEEGEQRLSQYGFNEIPEKEESLLHRIFKRFWAPIPWMIEAAALLSALVEKWSDLAIILVLLFTNAFIDLWQESKALSALKVLKEKLAKNALVMRDGAFKIIPARELVPGDIIKIKIGDVVPADVKLIDGDFIQSDQSALTGESLPVSKNLGDLAYSNSVVKQGEMLSVVVNTATNTFFGKTVSLVAKAQKSERSHFQKAVMAIGNYLILMTLFLAVVIIVTALFRHENMLEILRFTLVLTVAAIPVALPAVLSVTMAVGAMNLAKKQAIVSRLVSIEELAGVDILCSDKTGTLTQNRMSISEPFPFNGHTVEDLLVYAALASKKENEDPIEVPIFEFIQERGWTERVSEYQQLKFIPFDPVSKRAEGVVKKEEETFQATKGATQVILDLCGGSGDWEEVSRKVQELAEKGFRTLGVAVKHTRESKYGFIGLLPLSDPPREDSAETIAHAKELGINIKMVTGDNIAIAKQIAGVLQIGENLLDARDLKGASNQELLLLGEIITRALYAKLAPGQSAEAVARMGKDVVKEIEKELNEIELPKGYVKKHESEIIKLIEDADGFAQVFPEDKYFIVDELQKADHMVGMTGDGVNDAPALKKADAGIAVSGATDAARASADLVLLAPGLSVIVDAIVGARVTFERMKSYSIYRVSETIRVILFMTAAITVFNFYPVTAIMIIILAFLNDLPILAIAYDHTKVDKDPVRWNMKEVIGLSTILGVLGVIASFLIFYIAEEYMRLSQEVVQSFIFLKLAIAGHLTIFVTRTEKRFWQKPYPSAVLFWAAFLTKIAATVFAVYGWFIEPIGWKYALWIWAYCLAWFVLNDFAKVAVYRMMKRDNNLR